MKLKNLDKVIKLEKRLDKLDKEIKSIEDNSNKRVTFTVGDIRSSNWWHDANVLDMPHPDRAKMVAIMMSAVKKIRLSVIKELVELGVTP